MVVNHSSPFGYTVFPTRHYRYTKSHFKQQDTGTLHMIVPTGKSISDYLKQPCLSTAFSLQNRAQQHLKTIFFQRVIKNLLQFHIPHDSFRLSIPMVFFIRLVYLFLSSRRLRISQTPFIFHDATIQTTKKAIGNLPLAHKSTLPGAYFCRLQPPVSQATLRSLGTPYQNTLHF